MQAILTKILPATNYRQTRIKATCAAGSLTVGYHDIDEGGIFNEETRHAFVARELMQKLWPGTKYDIITGCLPNGDFCHTLTMFPAAAMAVRDMIREGTPTGNPHLNPAYRQLFQQLANHKGVDYNEL